MQTTPSVKPVIQANIQTSSEIAFLSGMQIKQITGHVRSNVGKGTFLMQLGNQQEIEGLDLEMNRFGIRPDTFMRPAELAYLAQFYPYGVAPSVPLRQGLGSYVFKAILDLAAAEGAGVMLVFASSPAMRRMLHSFKFNEVTPCHFAGVIEPSNLRNQNHANLATARGPENFLEY